MLIIAQSASLALLMSFTFGVADAIRLLKEGPMIDSEGREYKSLKIDEGSISGPKFYNRPPIHVQCTEASVTITIRPDLYKNGLLLSPGKLFLGEAKSVESSQCQAAPAGDTEYVIEAGLRDCGSKVTLHEDAGIYSNKLVFSPAVGYFGLTRMSRAVIPISCHFKRDRTQSVSSNVQQPLLPSSAQHSAGSSAFCLKPMSGDWRSELSSGTFHLGDTLHLEASYTGPDRGRRRLFIDSCVATLTPDAASVPRYYFIQNHGCLTDAKDGGINTQFIPRTRTDSLQLQLGAFLFQGDSRNSIFITCQLKATPEVWKSSPSNKACNYMHSRWKNVDGNDSVCQCCEGICYKTPHRDMAPCGTVVLGPLMIFHRK